jgi:hypothetical protein
MRNNCEFRDAMHFRAFQTIILPAVRLWFNEFKEENKLRVSENSVLEMI